MGEGGPAPRTWADCGAIERGGTWGVARERGDAWAD